MSPRSRCRGVALALSLSLTTFLVACSTGDASPSVLPTKSAPASVAPFIEPSPSPVAAFPITVTDDEGTEVSIPAEPQRIVSLSPANTEILFELGVGDRVVATDNGSDYPEGASSLPDVTSFGGAGVMVDVEQILALDADLVVAAGAAFTPRVATESLRAQGIPVVVVDAASVAVVYHDIELIGTAIGESDAAIALTTSMRAQIEAISAAVATEARPRVFYEVGYTDTTGQIYGPPATSFVAEMVVLAGADPVTTGDDPNDYEIALEQLIEADPQIIVLGVNPFYSPTPQGVAARTGWGAITAVKDGDVRTVRDIEITRPGPRLPVGLRNLAAAIWPDVALPAAP